MSRLLLLLTFVCCFTLATHLAPVFDSLRSGREAASSPLQVLVGEGRQLFANQFFTEADVYFHSGYYPTIFDAKKNTGPSHLDVASHEQTEEPKTTKQEPDDDDSFMGTPRDCIERFGRNFIPTIHTHLHGINAGEILPWLRLSADLDPKRVDTFVTGAYWLRTDLNKPTEAARFLREGLRANPDSSEILLELGRVYAYNETNLFVARNIWENGVKKWHQQDKAGKKPDPKILEELWGEMVRSDEKAGNLQQLLADLEELKKAAPMRRSLDTYIQNVKARLAGQPTSGPPH